MDKKKWLYICLLIVLIVPILFFYQAFNGNPVTKYFSKAALKSFLAETYPENEYYIREQYYNFKIGGYTSKVVQIGDEQQTEYEFEVTGLLNPTVTLDGIYYGNLDIPLIERLSEEAEDEITSELTGNVPEITDIYVQIEVLKGKYESDTVWKREMQLEKPIRIILTLDVTNMTKEEVLKKVKTIQQTLQEENYVYEEVSFNGNMFGKSMDGKDNRGYLKYAVGFDKDTNITLDDIEVYEQ